MKNFSIFEQALKFSGAEETENLGEIASLARRDFIERESFICHTTTASVEGLHLSTCDPAQYGGEGDPQGLIVSDLPMRGDSAERSQQQVDAMSAALARLRRYYDDDAIVEIVGVIAFAGFMNRWNDTIATPLEDGPLSMANQHLGSLGWEAGPHA